MTAIRHVALVGCGFTGTSAFFQLVDRYPVREISIFEKSGRLGPGYPYQPDECRDYLINNTTDTMCLVSSNRRAFLEWLRMRGDARASVDEKSHVPRGFGDFLQDVFAATRTAAAIKGIKVNLIPFEVTEMSEDETGTVELGWSGGRAHVDMAILSTSRCPDLDRYQTPSPGAGARYISNHIRTEALDDLPLDATVHVLGASLSAYDVVNRLFSPQTGCRFDRDGDGDLRFVAGDNRRRMVLCSRSGRLKKMQSRSPASLDRQRFTLRRLRDAAGEHGLTLEALADFIAEEARARCRNNADTEHRLWHRRCAGWGERRQSALQRRDRYHPLPLASLATSPLQGEVRRAAARTRSLRPVAHATQPRKQAS